MKRNLENQGLKDHLKNSGNALEMELDISCIGQV